MTTRVAFVAGIGRSGSTLVERILTGLPGVVGLGELNHLWHRGLRLDERCGCGVAFSRCEFWQGVGEQAFGGWSRVDPDLMQQLARRVDRVWHVPALMRGRANAELASAVARYGEHYAAVYAAVIQLSGASVVVDSSKHASLAHVLRQRSDVDLRVVHCVRDARAVCFSWTRRKLRPDTTSRESYMPTFRPRVMAVRWNAYNLATDLLRRRGVPVSRLRYEDLVADPVGSVARLAEFIGAPADPRALSFIEKEAVTLPVTHTVAGNPMRFDVGRVPLHLDDAWRSSLPHRQRWLVTAITLPLMARYGYLSSPPAPR
ncbi:sulfotransferase [Micromonospora sp. CPCC 205371]|nr:sulfotransferase [Micromonospora sp. CPCC 205371]